MKHLLFFFLLLCVYSATAQVAQSDIACSTPNLTETNALALPYFGNNQIIENHLVSQGYDNLQQISFPSSSPQARNSSTTFLEPKFLIPLNVFIYWNGANNADNAIDGNRA